MRTSVRFAILVASVSALTVTYGRTTTRMGAQSALEGMPSTHNTAPFAFRAAAAEPMIPLSASGIEQAHLARGTRTTASRLGRVTWSCVRRWWALPLALVFAPAVVPLCNGFTRTLTMPSWWSITPVWAGCGVPFVLTNLPYLYFGMRLWREEEHPPMLAALLTISGIVSVLYHTVQSASVTGAVTEALCYVDHGFAITSALYFAKTCWPLGPRSVAMFAGGLALLPGWGDKLYTMTHSLWHGFSATAAYIACRERVARLRRLAAPIMAHDSAGHTLVPRGGARGVASDLEMKALLRSEHAYKILRANQAA